MASEDNTVIQNMLGTLKECYFRVKVCTLSTDAHPYKVFGCEYVYNGCAVHCLPDIVHKPLSGPNMLGTFFPN